MLTKLIAIATASAGLAVLPGIAAADAAVAPASVTVTIKAEGTDMFGVVKSSKPARCADNRTVKVFKLVHGEPHLWATDTTELQGNQGVWSTGNTGTEGKFYAKVRRTSLCKVDLSPTIKAVRND